MRKMSIPFAAMAMFIAGCTARSNPHGGETSSGPPFFPVATIQELMDSEIDPAADFIWGSVGTVITAAGEEDRKPTTDEQWLELRRHAINLVEATNLLVIPGRRVANTPFPSAGPGVLSSEGITAKVGSERASFDAYALALRQVALTELKAIDDRDAVALSSAGEALDQACEACHVANWYPHEVIPALPDFKPSAQNGTNQSIGLPDH